MCKPCVHLISISEYVCGHVCVVCARTCACVFMQAGRVGVDLVLVLQYPLIVQIRRISAQFMNSIAPTRIRMCI